MDTLRTASLSEHVLLLMLDRPQVRNAIDSRMAAELGGFFRSLEQAAGTDDVRAVVVTGAGSAFCAGADLKERLGMTEETWVEHHLFLEEAFAAIRRCPVPLVAAVNGAAIGGGCELMLACDLAVAAETATFSHPEVRRGIIPGCGATWILPRVIGVPRAKEMILTGRAVSAAEALGWGLVNQVVPEVEVLPRARALAEAIAANGPVAVRNARRALDEGLGLSQEEGVAGELDAYRKTLASADRREGIDAFNEKRPPRFRNR